MLARGSDSQSANIVWCIVWILFANNIRRSTKNSAHKNNFVCQFRSVKSYQNDEFRTLWQFCDYNVLLAIQVSSAAEQSACNKWSFLCQHFMLLTVKKNYVRQLKTIFSIANNIRSAKCTWDWWAKFPRT